MPVAIGSEQRDPMRQDQARQRSILWGNNQAASREALLGRASALATRLPASRFAINLAEDRSAFMVGLIAALMRDQIVLLPPSRAAGVVNDIQRRYPDHHILVDARQEEPAHGLPEAAERVSCIGDADLDDQPSTIRFAPKPEQTAVIAFTSGSTGDVTAHAKTWESVRRGALLAAERFSLNSDTGIVATVPAQHMYGLETSVFYAMIAGCSVHWSRPVLPAEIRQALIEVETSKRLLVTTPIHLRSIVQTDVVLPGIDAVISATAPLSAELAGLAEARLAAPVYEIYGCTEAGSIASRRTVREDIWTLYDGVAFSATDTEGRPMVHGGHVSVPTALSDVLDRLDDTRFRLIGRAADQVSVAGKRASLGDLNQKLCAIDGIDDGVFIMRGDDGDGRVRRLACLYVSPSLDEPAVMAELRRLLDPAFLPRPIKRVERLPYNDLGKLPRRHLLDALLPATPKRAGASSTSAA